MGSDEKGGMSDTQTPYTRWSVYEDTLTTDHQGHILEYAQLLLAVTTVKRGSRMSELLDDALAGWCRGAFVCARTRCAVLLTITCQMR